ncbi:angiopoietin-2-like [Anopheles arabiensis]|uniref:angiopoietin-2-like n=1 Tax=Anopheles arabiensis TaxID=7173 RepID=UPI001AACC4E8|nr:angiopoietin-2-like [Anopheles arabiensis]
MAKGMRAALQKHHQKTTMSTKVSLLKKLCKAEFDESGDMEAHLFRMDELFSSLMNADFGFELESGHGSEKYARILRSSDDDLTMEFVKNKLLDEAQKRMEKTHRTSAETTEEMGDTVLEEVTKKVKASNIGASQSFSTYDLDLDNSESNCAVSNRGAWWYTNCGNSNLNGLYLRGLTGGMFWETFQGVNYSLKKRRMMLRR